MPHNYPRKLSLNIPQGSYGAYDGRRSGQLHWLVPSTIERTSHARSVGGLSLVTLFAGLEGATVFSEPAWGPARRVLSFIVCAPPAPRHDPSVIRVCITLGTKQSDGAAPRPFRPRRPAHPRPAAVPVHAARGRAPTATQLTSFCFVLFAGHGPLEGQVGGSGRWGLQLHVP